MYEAIGPMFLGLALAMFLGAPVHLLLKYVGEGYLPELKLVTGTMDSRLAWSKLVETSDWGGLWIGQLERISFLLVIATVAAETALQIIGAWYAFKLASKWEAWTSIGRVPDSLKDDTVDPLDYARVRRLLAARTYSNFLVGTLANVLAAWATLWIVRQIF